ncbi:DUF4330 family protein [Brevibacillus massiliensis]|jgi:hypothetical protein|uniref:DUF4330 family protein n=1 Tax=Brevibacillus massiliensis TaxID=1118054 RepID=UPI0002DADFD6|nr:DUF4330 family protein [Brevibacillus massiliensis]
MKTAKRTSLWRSVFLVLLALAVVWLTAEKFAIRSKLGEGPRQTLVSVRAEGVRDFEAAAIIKGDNVYKKGELTQIFGKIVEVEVRPAMATVFDRNTGEAKNAEVPSMYDVYFTIEATASKSPYGNTLVNNGLVELNQYFPIYTNHGSFKTRVLGIQDKQGGTS